MNKETILINLEHFESDVLEKIKYFKDMIFALDTPKDIHNYEIGDYLLVVNGEVREVSDNSDFEDIGEEEQIAHLGKFHKNDKATVMQVIENWQMEDIYEHGIATKWKSQNDTIKIKGDKENVIWDIKQT